MICLIFLGIPSSKYSSNLSFRSSPAQASVCFDRLGPKVYVDPDLPPLVLSADLRFLPLLDLLLLLQWSGGLELCLLGVGDLLRLGVGDLILPLLCPLEAGDLDLWLLEVGDLVLKPLLDLIDLLLATGDLRLCHLDLNIPDGGENVLLSLCLNLFGE